MIKLGRRKRMSRPSSTGTLTTSQTIEDAQKIAKEHIKTHSYPDKDPYYSSFAKFVNCDNCGGEIPLKFHKNGKPCDNTKYYHMRSSRHGGITYHHNNLRICYEKILGKKW